MQCATVGWDFLSNDTAILKFSNCVTKFSFSVLILQHMDRSL